MHPKKTITILSAVAILLFVYYSSDASPIVSDEKYTYMSGLVWYKHYDDGQRVAYESDKPMLVYFWATWCKFCKKMENEVFPNTQVNEMLRDNFVLIAIDIDDNKEDADRFGVWVPPAEKFLTPDGQIIDEIGGYLPEANFLSVLQQVKAIDDSRKQTQ